MDQIARPGGFSMIFRFLRYFQYAPYIAIGLLIIAIAIWIVFAKKKLRWAKILAIVLTILIVIFAILSLATIFFGRNLPQGDFPEGFPGDGEHFQDRREFDQSQNSGSLEMELDNYLESINKSYYIQYGTI